MPPGSRSTGRTAVPGGRASGSGSRRSARTLGRIADHGLGRVLRGRDRRAPGPGAGGRRLGDRRGGPRRPRLDLDRADRDRLPRRPGDEPPAQQLGLRGPRDPQRPRAVRAAAGRDVRRRRRRRPALDPPRDRGGEAGDGRPRRAPDRPGDLRGAARAAARPGYAAELAARIDPARAQPAAGRQRAPRRRDHLARRRRRRGRCGQPHRVELHGLRVRRRRSGDRDRLPEPGLVLQPRPGPPERPRARRSGRSTRCCPGCSSATGGRGSSLGSMGGDAQPQIHAQVVSALVDGGVDVATRRRRCRAGSSSRRSTSRRPIAVRVEPRFRPGCSRSLAALGHAVRPRPSRSTARLGHCHAIELVDGGPADGGTLAAATDPRSAGLPAVW